MKATFADFINENPTCVKFADNPDAKKLFDFLSEESNIIDMIAVCDTNKPALAACASKIEKFVETNALSQIDLTDKFTRTMVGRMIKTILSPFGYLPTTQIDLTQSARGKIFTSGTRYEKKGYATMEIVKTIREIPKEDTTRVLSLQFEAELIENAEIAWKKYKYPAVRYLQMIKQKGGVDTAKVLIHKEMRSGSADGFIRLLELGATELSMEASVVKEKYAPLFTDEEIRFCKDLLGVN